MKRFFWILLVSIFLIACGDKVPAGIFSEQKMENLLYDIHLADGYLSSYPVDSLEKQKVNFYKSVYNKYETDSAEFRRNMEYYAAHPQQLENIYANISKRYQRAEQSSRLLDMEKGRAQYRQDSIARQREKDRKLLFTRDSLLLFRADRDLFLKPDTAGAKETGALQKSIARMQKKWELQFYYFSEPELPLEKREGVKPED